MSVLASGIPDKLYRRVLGNHVGRSPAADSLLRGHRSVPHISRPQPRGAFRVTCFTRASGLMATPDSDQEFQQAMDALGTLISGKVRGDGKTWKDAFEYMQVYLEVSYGPRNASTAHTLSFSL